MAKKQILQNFAEIDRIDRWFKLVDPKRARERRTSLQVDSTFALMFVRHILSFSGLIPRINAVSDFLAHENDETLKAQDRTESLGTPGKAQTRLFYRGGETASSLIDREDDNFQDSKERNSNAPFLGTKQIERKQTKNEAKNREETGLLEKPENGIVEETHQNPDTYGEEPKKNHNTAGSAENLSSKAESSGAKSSTGSSLAEAKSNSKWFLDWFTGGGDTPEGPVQGMDQYGYGQMGMQGTDQKPYGQGQMPIPGAYPGNQYGHQQHFFAPSGSGSFREGYDNGNDMFSRQPSTMSPDMQQCLNNSQQTVLVQAPYPQRYLNIGSKTFDLGLLSSGNVYCVGDFNPGTVWVASSRETVPEGLRQLRWANGYQR